MLFSSKPKYEFLIIGLGNIGDKYTQTRHNVGFRCADILINELNAGPEKNKFHALNYDASFEGHKILISKPLTFMNNSGMAVSEITKFYKIPHDKVIIICDDVAMDVGKLRIRKSGSHGGHNGLKDIFELCGTDTMPRIKIGVGQKPHPDYDLADWVLGKPSEEDSEIIHTAEENCVKAIKTIITKGFQDAMNNFNR